MRFYVSGPMRGYEDFNYPAFNNAAMQLRLLRHDVWNPAECEVWDLDHGPVRAINLDTSIVANWADAVLLLEGWERSLGSNAEVAVARWRELDFYRFYNGRLTQVWPQFNATTSGFPTKPYRSGKAFSDAVTAEVQAVEHAIIDELTGRPQTDSPYADDRRVANAEATLSDSVRDGSINDVES